ncbi:hypothetical protein HMPREF1869_00445 [Bacteroidales bacterium KA00251]|nr:hypothetical protein HMPREF1869_00445 [Bacteroidales bacterium KA00251]
MKVKTLAIAMMALSLFACKKQEPKKTEAAVLSLRIDDAQLRAIEAQITDGTTTTITENVKVILNNGAGRTYTLTPDQIAAAKTLPDGCKFEVTDAVTAVTLIANAEVKDDTSITTWQGKGAVFQTAIPLTATTTDITSTTSNGKITYKADLTPKPAFARLEVFGKIEPKANDNGKKAFESIEVKEVYINNYLDTRKAAKRYFTDHNASLDGFETATTTNSKPLKPQMKDVVTDKAAFESGAKAAAYQLFPKKDGESATVSDHVILKLGIKYSTDAKANGFPDGEQIRYVTIKKFKTGARPSGKLDPNLPALKFSVGTIYKLNLNGLNDHFKTKEDGTPDPNNPDTTEPESKGKKELQLIVRPCRWTAQNILPQL